MDYFIEQISNNKQFKPQYVSNVLKLLADGATIPFISRYRKEMTGSMDELQIAEVKAEYDALSELEKRKQAVIKSITEQEKLTPELEKSIKNAKSLTEVEDIYLPYKQKRKTKASIAKEKGLEPLAKIIMKQDLIDLEAKAANFLTGDIESTDDALQGARDIMAEWINENIRARNQLRRLFTNQAIIQSKVVKTKKEEASNYKDYFEYQELLKKCPSHRLLAMFRAETEGFLRIKVAPATEDATEILEDIFIKSVYDTSEQVRLAIADAYKRLLEPSIENEFRGIAKEKADKEAILVFTKNLRQLLMASPLGQKRILAIDPGYRTGCKVVCLDAQGNLLHNETIYPHPPQNDVKKAKSKIDSLVGMYKIEAIAIGNGTAGRETENLIRNTKFNHDVLVFVVNEAGASVYSASKIARQEFPDYDVTVRGAVSIGRRLMDPLAELVKIDAKSIGVGQYQHDVDQTMLKNSLDQVVESCVNAVGVDLNTASKHLLTYISGLGPQLAENIVQYRSENGAFKSRSELLKVPRLGAKAFEQCAGFLRIRNGKTPLDNTAVHPERYQIVHQMAEDIGVPLHELITNNLKRKEINLNKYVNKDVGLPTLQDILHELEKPGRDPRAIIKVFQFADGIFKPEQLAPGMVLPGIVTNITNFGAFVDVGVKQDGLVHISQLADRFISDPNDVVQLNQHVQVKVLEVDLSRKRIAFTMKGVVQ